MVNLLKSRMNQFNYAQWSAYFAKNNEHRLEIDFSEEKGLTAKEQALIFPSIKAFQKGEGSDGSYLMKTVDSYIEKGGDKEYREAMQWFVKEENFHSAYLRKYMDFYDVKVAESNFLDSAFRKARKMGGLKCEVIILVTAEMIALTYYDALSNCTDSAALKSICAQMLHDELPHIMFQSHTLKILKPGIFERLLRMLTMEVTSLLVWLAYSDVFKKGGYTYSAYRRANMTYLEQSIRLSKAD